MNITRYLFDVKKFFSRLFTGETTEGNATKSQLDLLNHMEYLSEKYMCAGWLGDLDDSMHYTLYNSRGCRHFFLMDPITKEDYNKLKELFLDVKGWWRFDEETDRIFLPFKEWRKRHNSGQPLPVRPLEYEEHVDYSNGNKMYNT